LRDVSLFRSRLRRRRDAQPDVEEAALTIGVGTRLDGRVDISGGGDAGEGLFLVVGGLPGCGGGPILRILAVVSVRGARWAALAGLLLRIFVGVLVRCAARCCGVGSPRLRDVSLFVHICVDVATPSRM
jgi:hypothetical protein